MGTKGALGDEGKSKKENRLKEEMIFEQSSQP